MKVKIVRLLLVSLFFATCSTSENTSTQSGCITPIVGFSYPLKGPDNNRSEKVVVPYAEWKEEATLPLSSGEKSGMDNSISFARNINDKIEIWLFRWSPGVNHQPKFMIYRLESEDWEIINQPYPELLDAYSVDAFLIDNNQTLWAVSWFDTSITFLKLDERERKFNISRVKPALDEARLIKVFWANTTKTILRSSKIWHIENGSLYSFDPVSDIITKHNLNISNAIIDVNNGAAKYYAPKNVAVQDELAVSGNADRIYLLSNESPELIEYYPDIDQTVRKLIPVITEDIGLVSAPYSDAPPIPGRVNGDSLFVDLSNNLWVNDYGWMEEGGNWNVVIRSPLFVGEFSESLKYAWSRPHVILQSNDHTLWFSSVGLVSLNPNQGTWCMVTQAFTNIVEDSEHNLWMIADGKLYRLPLGRK